jgi:hypothetical protein
MRRHAVRAGRPRATAVAERTEGGDEDGRREVELAVPSARHDALIAAASGGDGAMIAGALVIVPVLVTFWSPSRRLEQSAERSA